MISSSILSSGRLRILGISSLCFAGRGSITSLGLWLDSEGVMTNPSANDIISMALDALIDGVYPKAKGFVNK